MAWIIILRDYFGSKAAVVLILFNLTLFFYLNSELTLFALMPVCNGCSCCRNNINAVICCYVIQLHNWSLKSCNNCES